MIVLSHPTGNANVRQAVRALNEAGLLSEFWTCVCWKQHHLLNLVLPRSVTCQLERRTFSHIPPNQLHCHPWLELARLAARQLKLSRPLRHEVGRFCVDAVYRSLDLRVAARLRAAPGACGVYAYDDGALASFRVARQLGMKTIYELPIGYWRCYRELMEEEAALRPEWAVTLQGRTDSDEKLRRKDEELALATDIIVPSDFVRDTLRKAGHLKASVTVIPYGAPPPIARHRLQTDGAKDRNRKLKVLFVGGLSQRKGLSYLLEAVTRLSSRIELTLVGHRVAECNALDAALRLHRWIPSLPHAALLKEMSSQDVMVFPSLFEGFALVILEAMSQGVPVITTPNTGAGHFISNGEDGFIVPIRDAEAIVEKLEKLMVNRNRLAAMSEAAMRKAAQHPWSHYRKRLATTVRLALRKDLAPPQPVPQSPPLEAQLSC